MFLSIDRHVNSRNITVLKRALGSYVRERFSLQAGSVNAMKAQSLRLQVSHLDVCAPGFLSAMPPELASLAGTEPLDSSPCFWPD